MTPRYGNRNILPWNRGSPLLVVHGLGALPCIDRTTRRDRIFENDNCGNRHGNTLFVDVCKARGPGAQ